MFNDDDGATPRPVITYQTEATPGPNNMHGVIGVFADGTPGECKPPSLSLALAPARARACALSVRVLYPHARITAPPLIYLFWCAFRTLDNQAGALIRCPYKTSRMQIK